MGNINLLANGQHFSQIDNWRKSPEWTFIQCLDRETIHSSENEIRMRLLTLLYRTQIFTVQMHNFDRVPIQNFCTSCAQIFEVGISWVEEASFSRPRSGRVNSSTGNAGGIEQLNFLRSLLLFSQQCRTNKS